MPLPSSGPLSLNQIGVELQVSSPYSLNNMSLQARQNAEPHSVSELYSYSPPSWPANRIVYLNAADPASYPGSGTTWTDTISGYNVTLTNPAFTQKGGYFTSNSSTNFVMPGNSTIYSSDFTWCMRVKFLSTGTDWFGLWWSESGVKNFLIGAYVTNTSVFAPRIDTQSTSYQYWNSNSGTGNGGNSPAQSNANLLQTTPWSLLSVVKNGTTFTWYLNGDSAPLWQITINNWSIGSTTQNINLMCRSQGSFFAPAQVNKVVMFNRALSTGEIANVHLLTNMAG